MRAENMNVKTLPVLMLLATSGVGPDLISWERFIGPVYSTGVVGLVFFMLIFEKGIVTKRSLDRVMQTQAEEIALRDRQLEAKDKEIAELKASSAELQRVTNERIIPALVTATDAVRAYVAELARRGGTLGSG